LLHSITSSARASSVGVKHPYYFTRSDEDTQSRETVKSCAMTGCAQAAMEQVRRFTRLPCLQMPVRTHLSITHPLSERALVRSDLWKAASSGRPQGVPTLGDFVAARDPEINSAAFDAAYSQRIPNELY
jgi:hypothetical protein